MQRKRISVYLSSCFGKAILTAPIKIRREVFLCPRFVSDRWAATRNENWPGSLTVKQNEGKEEKAMTEEDKAKIAAATAAAKAKAKEIVSKENIDKVKDSVKNGVESLKTTEGRQRLKESVIAGATAAKNKVVETWKSGPKGKAICIGVVAVLLVIGSMMSDDEDFASGRLGGEDDIMLSEKGFSSIFMNVGSPEADDGMIYRHQEDISVKVLQATSDGLLVGYVTGSNPFTSGIEDFVEKFGGSYDRVVFVTTDRDGYEDG